MILGENMKKLILIFTLIILAFFTVSCVCAGDVNDTSVIKESTSAVELSLRDAEIQSPDTSTYSQLCDEIASGGDKNLSFKYYTYDNGSTISITASGVIDGRGAVIDMAGSDIRAFNVNTSGVTFKNLTIKNACYEGEGGAIFFNSSGTIENCNFINNTIDNRGGAVYFSGDGTVENCNFINNTAYSGGAICFSTSGDVLNSNFNNNKATNATGGAFYIRNSGTVENCNFTDNSASSGGAIRFGSFGDVKNCNFINSLATDGWGGAILFFNKGSVENSNFFNNSASSGGAVMLESEGNVTNCNFSNNSAVNGGGAVFLLKNADVANCNFENNRATDGWGGAAYMNSANVFNCNFSNNTACNWGGAIHVETTGNFSYCNFTDNAASDWGGAVYFNRNGEVTNCNFANNLASKAGGAISIFTGIIENCNFTGNNATKGSAINLNGFSDTNISDSSFLNNRANASADVPLNVTVNENTIEITFMGQDNLLNAIYSNGDVNFSNVTYWGANGIANTGTSTIAPSNKEAGQNITITIVVNDILLLNTTKLTDKNGTIVLDKVAGNYSVTARHDTDSYYTQAETSKTFNIEGNESSLELNASANMVRATVSPDDAEGNVTFTVTNESGIVMTAGSVLNNGFADLNLTGLDSGKYNVTAIYMGNINYYPSKSAALNIVVNHKENATMDIDAPAVTEGENVTVNVQLPEDATGNVTACVEGVNYTCPVENGTASIMLPALAEGNYTVPVTYSGDDKYNPVTKEVNVTVEANKSDIISAPDVTKYYHGPEGFIVCVTDYKGNPLSNRTVKIAINGAEYTRTTDENGTAGIALGLNSGVYNATTSVGNQTVYSLVTVLTTVNGTDVVKVFRNGTQYYATFRDSNGNYLKDGTTVRFNINGVMYERKVSGNEGLARLNINLEQGEYVITAMNPETGENAANNITVIPRLVENNDVVKYYKNGTQYTVKVLGDDGNPVGANVTVKFNINGVFYERTTNESGIVKLNINLEPGDYVITAEYEGCRVSNNIKVLPVLTANDLTKTYGSQDQFVANLVDGEGNPYLGEKIEFNINGVFYNRTTNSTGQAALNINLQPGEYIITSSYNGANIANTIKVTA